MNSDQIFDAIEAIAGKPGKKDKEAGVAALMQDDHAAAILCAAYNPFKTYGIAKVPPRICDSTAGDEFAACEFALFEDLSSRAASGNSAREKVQATLDRLSPKSAELFTRIILKDLRAGFTDGTINRVSPGTLPEFPYMRCSLPKDAKLEKWNWAKGIFSQVKADGMFANVNVYPDRGVSVHSRQGTSFPQVDGAFLALCYDLSLLDPGHQYHGELLVKVDGKILPRQIGNGMLNKIAQGGELEPGHSIHYSVWDRIPLDLVKPKGKSLETYENRIKSLITMLKGRGPECLVSLIETKIVYSLREAYKHSTECMARGLEGTIGKRREMTWKDGTSKDQVKFKLEVLVDLKIVGFTKGNNDRAATFGAVMGETSDGLLKVNVGTGLKAKQLAEMNAIRDDLIDSVMAVKINDILFPSESNDLHSAFLPVFIEVRTDKSVADTLAQVIAQVEAAKQGEAAMKAAA